MPSRRPSQPARNFQIHLASALAVALASPGFAASPDCDIAWNEVLHDSFASDYRAPLGALASQVNESVRLRLRVAQNDITGARVRVWDDLTNAEAFFEMTHDLAFDQDPVEFDYWVAEVPMPADPTLLFYLFEITDDASGGQCTGNGGNTDIDFYLDDDPQFLGGGHGQMSDARDDFKSYQITYFDSTFSVPEWLQRATIYQIFPDRFRNGDTANDPVAGTGFIYGDDYFRPTKWNERVCDPRDVAGPCPDSWSTNFYGGDLAGITEKIESGFFSDLGVTVLYLNPIFRAPSNHRYDTASYFDIDPILGTQADFDALVAAAEAHGLRILLDGVFNHTSSDSTYFDLYSRYDRLGQLTSPDGPGADDDSGACEAYSSTTYAWFYFPDIGNPAGTCNNGPGGEAQTYEGWFGFGSLPKLRVDLPAVSNLFYGMGTDSVTTHWVERGVAGWRLDVADEVDCGATCDFGNDFWEGVRSAMRSVDSESILLGEKWSDVSAWLLGQEWDSAMNYRFRSALLGWLATNSFSDNDSNLFSSIGPIDPLTPSELNARLMSIKEDYPPQAFRAMMNLSSSHDTNRLRYLLTQANGGDEAQALRRIKQWMSLALTYPGAPTIYYGDEVGLSQDAVFGDGSWQDDPYNRAPFPWDDTPGDFQSEADLNLYVQQLGQLRQANRVLQDGEVHHGIVLDDNRNLYGFGRTNQEAVAFTLLNNDPTAHLVELEGLDEAPYALAEGTVLRDALHPEEIYFVQGGSVEVAVESEGAVILLAKPGLSLTLQGSCPGSVTATVQHALAQSQVALLGALDSGASNVPSGSCSGTLLALAEPKPLQLIATDSDGNGVGTLDLPAGLCSVRLQAIDLSSCETSSTATLPDE